MSRATTSTTAMALPSTSRSFTTIGVPTTTDNNKTSNNSLTSTFGSTNKAWGNSNIWGNGGLARNLTSRAAAPESSVSHLSTVQNGAKESPEIEGKTGSGSLVDSSVSDDWSYRSSWGTKRSLPSNRSISHAEGPVSQPRSASNAGLPLSFSAVVNNNTASSFASRPPKVNLSVAPSAQPGLGYGALSTARSAAIEQQPPLVFTKFDRPTDPNARKAPDSAKGGAWAEFSPTGERKGSLTMHTNSGASLPSSRNPSLPPSRHSDEPPPFMRPEYHRPAQRQSHSNSRTPSLSSQRNNNGYSSFANSNADNFSNPFGQLSLNGDGHPLSSHRPTMPGITAFTPTAPAFSALSLRSLRYRGGLSDGADDSDAIDLTHPDHFGSNACLSPEVYHGYLGYNGPLYNNAALQATRDLYSKSGQPFGSNAHLGSPWDATPGARSSASWTGLPNGPSSTSRLPPIPQGHNPYLDHHSLHQALPPSLRHHFPPIYGAYGLPSHLALDPTASFVNFVPGAVQGFDSSIPPHDPCAGESVQSGVMFNFKNDPKSKHWELKEIFGHIPEFSGDQHGSRFIQNRLETCNSDDKELVFREIQPNAIPLMTDVFGNYVIQKFFEHGDQMHKKILANKMRGQVLALSLQMYGCRVVQKALDHVLVDQQAQLVRELEGNVLKCVKDQNGNHVIQKAIERCPPSTIAFIIDAFRGQVQHLSIHPYGCRVIQRCLERCEPQSKAMIMHELMDGIGNMISDQYGNYVVQHVVEHDDGDARDHVLNIVLRGLESYSKHKFASNVVEKCLTMADNEWRRNVLYILAKGDQRKCEGDDVLVGLIKDNFGNYVIQKLLDTLSHEDYAYFLELLSHAMAQAKRSGCGKQVLSIEKKMHRFQTFRNGNAASLGVPYSNATNGAAMYALNLPLLPPQPPFAQTYGSSAATTPPPLTPADTSLQSSAIQSVNGDAVEGAHAAQQHQHLLGKFDALGL